MPIGKAFQRRRFSLWKRVKGSADTEFLPLGVFLNYRFIGGKKYWLVAAQEGPPLLEKFFGQLCRERPNLRRKHIFYLILVGYLAGACSQSSTIF